MTLATGVAQPVYFNTRTQDEIRRLAGAAVNVKDLKHSGLTRSRAELRIEPTIRWSDLPDGRYCIVLDKVVVDWRVAELTVDIARRYSPGSCEYREVREHEDEHVAITRETFARYEPKLRKRMELAVKEVGAVRTRKQPQKVAEDILSDLKRSARQVLDGFDAELKKRHGVIDTMANYRKISARCSDW